MKENTANVMTYSLWIDTTSHNQKSNFSVPHGRNGMEVQKVHQTASWFFPHRTVHRDARR